MPERQVNRLRKGLDSAYGRRRRWRSAIRQRASRELIRLASMRRGSPGDYIEFVPGSPDPEVLADVSGRVNWYLRDRSVPVYMDGAHGRSVDPQDARYLDPALVTDPGWEPSRPPGRAEIALHRATPAAVARFVRGSRRATLASATMSFRSDRGWFSLQERYGTTRLPSPADAVERISSLAVPGATALVLATGPSAQLVDPRSVTAELRVTCNSAVRDHALLEALRPDVITFADRVFHFGPSRYAAAFRADLLTALEITDALFVTISMWAGPLLANVPEIRDRLAVLPTVDGGPWHWPTPERPSARGTGNILTGLMLPVAFAIADDVQIAGCDGRNPDERYFWKHNARTQYTDDLMQSAFASHPGFFADRDYADYYERHCEELEEFLSAAEVVGKGAVGLTPSHIPALRARGAPAFSST